MRQRDRSTLVGLIVVGVAVWIAAWLLGPGNEHAATDHGRAAAETSGVVAPDGSEAVLPEPSGDSVAAPLITDETSVPAAPGMPDQPGEVLHLFGLVVGPARHPVADALVTHWPTAMQRSQIGLGPQGTFATGIPWERLASTRTDAEGRFAFDVRDESLARHALGGASLHPRSLLYEDEMEARPMLLVEHPQFGTLAVCVTAEHAGDVDVGEIVLQPGTTLVGRLVDPHGAPAGGVPLFIAVEGSHVEWQKRLLFRQAERALGTSDDAGRFRIPGLWPGTFSLETLPTAFAPLTRELAIDRPGELDLGDVQLQFGERIAGIVVDTQDRPVPGALVRARPSMRGDNGPDSGAIQWDMQVRYGNRPIRHDAVADAEGRFSVTGLWDMSPDFDVLAHADGMDAAIATVDAGRTDVVLRLQPQATWLLHVVDTTSGEPIAGASLKARRHGGEREFMTGTVEVEAVAGSFLLRGASSTRTDAVLSAPGHATQDFALPGLAAGDQGEQTLSLPRESVLSGRVVDDEQRPLARAIVQLSPPRELFEILDKEHAFTDSQGMFRFSALSAGEWSVEVAAPGCLPMAAARKTMLVAGAQEEIELVLPRGGTITGTVLDAEGQPVTDAWVSAATASPEALAAALQAGRAAGAPAPERQLETLSLRGFTGATGRFTLSGAAPGEWKVDGGEGAQAVVTLAAHETVDVVLTRPHPPRVSGNVTRDGQPAGGALVELGWGPEIGDSWSVLAEARTDNAGHYELELAADGTRYVRALAGALASRPVPVELAWNGTQQVDLALPTGRVRGRVVDGVSGEPVAGVPLKLGDPALLARGRDDAALEASSGPDGRFLFEPVGAGIWMIEADSPDWCVARLGGVTVVERGAEPDVLVALARGAIIEIDLGENPGGVSIRLSLAPLDGSGDRHDSNGKLAGLKRFTRLAAGEWELRVERREGKAMTQLHTETLSVTAGETVRVQVPLSG